MLIEGMSKHAESTAYFQGWINDKPLIRRDKEDTLPLQFLRAGPQLNIYPVIYVATVVNPVHGLLDRKRPEEQTSTKKLQQEYKTKTGQKRQKEKRNKRSINIKKQKPERIDRMQRRAGNP